MKCPGEQLKTSQSGLPLMCSERSSADVGGAVARCVGRPDLGREHLSMSIHGSRGLCSLSSFIMDIHMRCPRCWQSYTFFGYRYKTMKGVKRSLAKVPEYCFLKCAPPVVYRFVTGRGRPVLFLDMTKNRTRQKHLTKKS